MSTHFHEPVLHATQIIDLRPTQLTVGMREVRAKRLAWRERRVEQFEQYLSAHMVPAVVGPGGKRYLIDHHHLTLALFKEGVESVFVSIVADFSRLDEDAFWNLMDFRGWTHPFDTKGRRQSWKDLPKSVDRLEDDPYRSLAGELRNIGGFAKDTTPFSEFVWADFFRRRIALKDLEGDFATTLTKALEMAKSPDADYLPGWCAVHKKKAKKPVASAT